MKLEQLPNGRWAVCEDDGTILQTWKTERCARFDLECYLKGETDPPSAQHPPEMPGSESGS